MNKLFLVLSFVVLITCTKDNTLSEEPPSMATYIVDKTGIDVSTRNGLTLATAWLTPNYAVTRATVSGDIIHVNAGTYNITSQINLPVGVSIEGVGVTTIFNCTVNASDIWGNSGFAIRLSSGSKTNGNQSISNIKMDGGNLAGWGAIGIWYRNNVTVYNCNFINFSHWGVRYYGGEPPANAAAYITGSVFRDNVVTNCAGYYSGSIGGLGIGGVDGMLIYNNTITQYRNGINDGVPIYGVEGYIKNVKIYNNTISKTHVTGISSWDFAIEIWNWQGGNEIYNNNITGSIDVQYASKGTSTYSVWIHDNIIGQPNLVQRQSIRGVLLEVWNSDVIIERNYIHHVCQGIYLRTHGSSVCYQNNIYIRYNVFDQIGAATGTTSPSGWGCYFSQELPVNDTCDNFNFYNNTVIASTSGVTKAWGVSVPDLGTSTNATISNNIIQGFNGAPIQGNGWNRGASINGLAIFNNIFWGNGNNNDPNLTATGFTATGVTGLSPQTNLKSVPPFVSSINYHLTTARIGKYITSGLTDKDGVAVANPPTIGAYEYGATGGLALTKSLTDSSTITDNNVRTLVTNKLLTDILTITDANLKITSKSLSDFGTLSDIAYKETVYARSISEDTIITDAYIKNISIPEADSYTISDTISDKLLVIEILSLVDTLTLSDNSAVREIGRVLSDSITLSDTLYPSSVTGIQDSSTITDSISSKDIQKVLSDSVTFVDSRGTIVSIYSDDGFTITDAMTVTNKILELPLADSLALSDAILSAVISQPPIPPTPHRCHVLEILKRGLAYLHYANTPLVGEHLIDAEPDPVLPVITDSRSTNEVLFDDGYSVIYDNRDLGEIFRVMGHKALRLSDLVVITESSDFIILPNTRYVQKDDEIVLNDVIGKVITYIRIVEDVVTLLDNLVIELISATYNEIIITENISVTDDINKS